MTAAAEPWLVASGLRKEFDGSVAITDAGLALRAGEVRGVVGPNGAGKSTLMQLLAGLLATDGGTIVIDGTAVVFRSPADAIAAGIFLVPQEMLLAPNLTVAENIVLGNEPHRRGVVSSRASRRIAAKALARLDSPIDPDAAVGTLTPVERRLVMVARTLARDARLVILDEPTAALAPHEADSILDAVATLAADGVSFLYVSHRFDDIERIADTVTGVRDAHIIADVTRTDVSRASLVDMVTPVDAGDVGAAVRATRGHGRSVTGATVLAADGISSGILADVSLTVAAGEILGLAGLSGSGVDELLTVIGGITRCEAGSITVDGEVLPAGNRVEATRAGLAYVPGNRTLAIFPNHDVTSNITVTSLSALGRRGVPSARREIAAVKDLMARVGLLARPAQRVSALSGGNQQKVVFARWIGVGTKVLLLHDPTAGVDVRSRAEIHQRVSELAAQGVAIVLVTTDIPELADLSDRILVLDRGRPTRILDGADVTESIILAAMVAADNADRADGIEQPATAVA